MIPASSLPPAPLRLALRTIAVAAAADGDPVLREFSVAMAHLCRDGSEEGPDGPMTPHAGELQLRERLLVLNERCGELRLRIEAEACLQHAAPTRARQAQDLLEGPWPARTALSDEETLVPGALDLAAAQAHLGAVQSLVTATDAARLIALDLLPLRDGLITLCADVAALLLKRRLAAIDGRDFHAEAAGFLFRYRAYVVVATGKLSAGGEDRARRQRLLEPLYQLL